MHRIACFLLLATATLSGPCANAHPGGGHEFGGWHGGGGPAFGRHDGWRGPDRWHGGWVGPHGRPVVLPRRYGGGWGGWGVATGFAAGAATEEFETPNPPCAWNGPYGCPDVVYQGPYALPAPPASLYPGPGGY